MGSQWNGMGRNLLNLPIFAETVAKCDRVLKEKNIDIYKILTSEDPTLFDDITNAFVGIITVQVSDNGRKFFSHRTCRRNVTKEISSRLVYTK